MAGPGWYPADNGMERFWNGERWTDQYRPPPVPPGSPPGWYPNPEPGGQGMRWWDGRAWGPPPTQATVVQPMASGNSAWVPVAGWFMRHWVVSLILVFFVVGGIGSLFGAGDETPSSAKDNSASSSSGKSSTEDPTDSPAPPSPSPQPKSRMEQLQDAVDESDAKSPEVKMTGRHKVEVLFKVQDNFSDNLIRTGIALDVFDMAEQIAETDIPLKEVAFRGLFPLVDQYGNTKDGQVFYTTLRGSDIVKINYDNIMITTWDSLVNLAIQHIVVLHPDLR